jgi:hypothetical protein
MSPRRRRIARFAVSGVVLLAFLAGLWLVAGRASATAASGGWAEVRRDDLVIGAPVSGTLASVQALRIGPPQVQEVWDYKIAFMAPEGAQVRAGEPVLGFDTSELERELLDKVAERDSAQKELEKRQTNLEIAARVREMEDAIRRMMVTAPRDGTVVYVDTGQGEKKKVGDSAWRGQSVLEIPDLRTLKAEGEIDEADAGRVAVGQRVTLRLDAHPDDVFTGRVRSIGGAVRAKSDINPLKIVKLEIDLDRTDPQRMRPGMRFTGTVEIERLAKALVVPAETVFTRPDGPVVYRRQGWGAEEVRPVLGKKNERLVEIRKGLSLGDKVSQQDLGEEDR